MKAILTLAVTLFLTGIVAAQTTPLKGFVFPEFVKGEVVMKNGSRNFADANYDAFGHRVILKSKEGNYIALGGQENVVMVVMDKKVFVPAGGEIFYEEVPLAGGNRYYIQYRTEFTQQGTSMPFGGASQTTASQSVSQISGASGSGMTGSAGLGGRFDMNSDPNVKEKTRNLFYVKDGMNFKQIISVKSLTSLFKPHKEKIEAFAKENKIKFTEKDDVAKIVDYCYSL